LRKTLGPTCAIKKDGDTEKRERKRPCTRSGGKFGKIIAQKRGRPLALGDPYFNRF